MFSIDGLLILLGLVWSLEIKMATTDYEGYLARIVETRANIDEANEDGSENITTLYGHDRELWFKNWIYKGSLSMNQMILYYEEYATEFCMSTLETKLTYSLIRETQLLIHAVITLLMRLVNTFK